MQPAAPLAREDFLPVKISRPHLAGRRMPAVIERHTRPDPRADFGEIKSHARFAADPIIFFHHYMGGVDPDRARMIQNNASNGIIGKFAHEPGAQAEAGAGVSDIKLSAADIHFEGFREFNPAMSGRGEADHAFTEREDVEAALGAVAKLYGHKETGL